MVQKGSGCATIKLFANIESTATDRRLDPIALDEPGPAPLAADLSCFTAFGSGSPGAARRFAGNTSR